jgi:hypothetical protein
LIIDDMTASTISFEPPSCGSKGTWFLGVAPAGTLTSPTGVTNWQSAETGTCGSLCESNYYSPLPSGFPGAVTSADASPDGAADAAQEEAALGDVSSGEAAPGDASPADAAAPHAMCIAGVTDVTQYANAGMLLEFAFTAPVQDGGPIGPASTTSPTSTPLPAMIDASQYTGIQFWLWVSPQTAAAVSDSILVDLFDMNSTDGFGICVPNAGTTACGAGQAAISGSTAYTSQGAGVLLSSAGTPLTQLAGGWQLVKVPFANFVVNPFWGGANEVTVDPRTLTYLALFVAQDGSGTTPVTFDYCAYDISFY